MWGEEVEPYLPEVVKIADVGWKAFLTRWNNEAFTLVKSIVLYEGISPGVTDEQLMAYEERLQKKVPTEVFKGSRLKYPGNNEEEQRLIEHRLRQIREVILEGHKQSPIRDYTDEMIAAGGAFRAPCTEEAIESAETRLNASLPPSYKAFLRISDGWLLMDTYLLPVERVDWYRNSKWLEWFEPYNEFFPEGVTEIGRAHV